MKRLLAVFLTFIILAAANIPAFAEGMTFTETGGDVVGIMRDMEVNRHVPGSAVVVMGNLDVRENVSGDVVVLLGDVRVNSSVSGSVVAILGKVTLEEKARVGGDVVSIGEIVRAGAVSIGGQQVSVNLGFLPLAYLNVILIIVIAALALLVLLIGLIGIAISRKKFDNISMSAPYKLGRKFVIGFLVYLGFTIITLFLAVTVVVPILYLLMIIFAEVVVSIYLGKLLMRMFNSNSGVYLEFFTGFIIVAVIKVLPIILIPQSDRMWLVSSILIYWISSMILSSFGIGALIDTKFGSRVSSDEI